MAEAKCLFCKEKAINKVLTCKVCNNIAHIGCVNSKKRKHMVVLDDNYFICCKKSVSESNLTIVTSATAEPLECPENGIKFKEEIVYLKKIITVLEEKNLILQENNRLLWENIRLSKAIERKTCEHPKMRINDNVIDNQENLSEVEENDKRDKSVNNNTTSNVNNNNNIIPIEITKKVSYANVTENRTLEHENIDSYEMLYEFQKRKMKEIMDLNENSMDKSINQTHAKERNGNIKSTESRRENINPQPYKENHTKRKSKSSFGTGKEEISQLRAANYRKKYLFVGNVHENCTTDTITDHVRKITQVTKFTCEKLQVKTNKNCFKLTIDAKLTDIIMNMDNWPEGIRIEKFYRRRENPKNLTPQKEQLSPTPEA